MILTIIVLSFVSLVIISFALFKKTKQKETEDQSSNSKLHNLNKKTEKTTRPNSIYLFGDFSVRNRNNKDVTYMFSVRLKQTFCLILQHSMEDGISSQRLSNLLWPGKPEDKVKNSRGVTINHLRKALSELEGIELIHDKGYFKIVQSSEFYCDYTRCIQIISTSNIEENTDELIEILTRGKFLKFFDQPLFDSFKIAVEQKLEPVLLVEMEKSFSTEVYQTTINFAEAIFNIDPLNDKALAFQIRALQKLKKTEEAIIKYQAFVIEYKKMMGNDYPYSFKDLN